MFRSTTLDRVLLYSINLLLPASSDLIRRIDEVPGKMPPIMWLVFLSSNTLAVALGWWYYIRKGTRQDNEWRQNVVAIAVIAANVLVGLLTGHVRYCPQPAPFCTRAHLALTQRRHGSEVAGRDEEHADPLDGQAVGNPSPPVCVLSTSCNIVASPMVRRVHTTRNTAAILVHPPPPPPFLVKWTVTLTAAWQPSLTPPLGPSVEQQLWALCAYAPFFSPPRSSVASTHCHLRPTPPPISLRHHRTLSNQAARR